MTPNEPKRLDPEGRTGSEGIWDFLAGAADYFEIGPILAADPIEQGHEDLNLRVDAKGGTFVCKVFANNQYGDHSQTRQTRAISQRLVDVTVAARLEGAATVDLLGGSQGMVYERNGLFAVAYHWIEGRTYFDHDRCPTERELANIAATAAAVSRTDIAPNHYDDLWAIPHIHAMYDKAYKAIPSSEDRLIRILLGKYDGIPWDVLPVTLVHGDITKANVVVRDDGAITLLDFSVANLMPRVIELAVIAANLLSDSKGYISIDDRCRLVVDAYLPHADLQEAEIDALPTIALSALAMEYLGSRWRQLDQNGNATETEYWIEVAMRSIELELDQSG